MAQVVAGLHISNGAMASGILVRQRTVAGGCDYWTARGYRRPHLHHHLKQEQLHDPTSLQDDLINSCEARLTELQSENAALQSSFQDSQKRLETAESRLSEVLEARAALRRKLETRDTEAAAMQASLQADIDVLKVNALLPLLSWLLQGTACRRSCRAGWPAGG